MHFQQKKFFKRKEKKIHKQKEMPQFLRTSKFPNFSTSLECLKVITRNY